MRRIGRIMFAVAIASSLVLSGGAADTPKIGKGKGPAVVPGENVTMSCPKCKDDFLVKVTVPPKGTATEKAVIAHHLCEKCGTKLVTKGAGKAKTEVAEHTCKGCK